MNSHTPGPWWFAADAPDTYAVGHGDLELCGGLRRDNARLIAAAPDLLDSLQRMVLSMVNSAPHYRDPNALDSAMAALRKATGYAL